MAIVPPSSTTNNGSSNGRLLVQIYQVANSQLQLTLTHTPVSNAGPLKELVFCGNSNKNNDNNTHSTKLVARLGNAQLIVWDLDRGVVTTTLETQDNNGPEEFLGLATAPNDFFYTLTRHGTKLVVHEYNPNKSGGPGGRGGMLTRKIKSGRWDGDTGGDTDSGSLGMLLAVSETHIVVQTSPGILRVMNSQTGNKIGKIKNSSSNGFSIIKLFDNHTLVGAQRGGMVTVYDVASCALIQTIPHPVTVVGAALLSDALLQLQGDKLMIEGTIFQKQGKNYEPVTSFKSTMNPIAPFLTNADKAIVMVHHNRAGCQARWFDLDDLAELVDLDKETQTPATAAIGSATTSSSEKAPKRKLTTEPMILGPGQAGVEIVPQPLKRSKAPVEGVEDADGDEKSDDAFSSKDITIAERLQQLTSALEEEDNDDSDDDADNEMDGEQAPGLKSNFKPHKATTESLKELMSQALQSGDDSLLELALSVRDVKVISTTLTEIGNPHIITLLSKLTTRLASNPLRAEGLAVWISRCLKQGRFQPRHLAPLRNLLYERTESFADLLRLEGRLALMCDAE
jgi:hypothetical protein